MSKEYIEREAATKEVAKWLADVFGIKSESRAGTLFKKLRSIPAADVVDVKHGRWVVRVDTPVGTVCSECGFSWSRSINAVTLNPALSKIQTRYCPNCGAKMDGGADNAAD